MEKLPKKKNPWITVWYAPRQTLLQILSTDPTRDIGVLVILSMIVQLIIYAYQTDLADEYPVMTMIATGVLLSIAGGYILLYIFSWLLKFTGDLLGGEASSSDLRVVIAWSLVPFIFTIFLYVVDAVVFKKYFFSSVKEAMIYQYPWFTNYLYWRGVAQLFLYLWSIVIFIVMLSEAQSFSVVWAVLNLILLSILLTVIGFIFFYFIFERLALVLGV